MTLETLEISSTNGETIWMSITSTSAEEAFSRCKKVIEAFQLVLTLTKCITEYIFNIHFYVNY